MNSTIKHPGSASAAEDLDAIAMLVADHKNVKRLFRQFEALKKADGSDQDKLELVRRVCDELKIHAQLEEEIFYPAVQKAINDRDLMDEAYVEHAGAKELIAQLVAMKPGDQLYDAKVTVLGELIEHHVKEEESEMFPKAKKAKLDLVALGTQMSMRKGRLEAESISDGAGDGQSNVRATKPPRGSTLHPMGNGR